MNKMQFVLIHILCASFDIPGNSLKHENRQSMSFMFTTSK